MAEHRPSGVFSDHLDSTSPIDAIERTTDFSPSTLDSSLPTSESDVLGLLSGSINGESSHDDHHLPLDDYESAVELENAPKPNPHPGFLPKPHFWAWYWICWFVRFIWNKIRTMTRRWVIGVVILLFVNFIWAASSIAVQAVFSGFDKPFFLTYFSTSLFTLFMSGFIFLKSWRDNDRIAEEMAHEAALHAAEQNPLLSDLQNSSVIPENGTLNTVIPEGDERPRKRKYLNDSPTAGQESLSSSEFYGDLRISSGVSSSSDNYGTKKAEAKVKMRDFAAASEDEWEEASSSSLTHQIEGSTGLQDLMTQGDAKSEVLEEQDATEAVGEPAEKKEIVPIFPVKRVALLALQFLPIWFAANVTFNWSLRGTSVTSNSIISTTSSFWTLLFCHLFKVERFTILRSIALVVTLGGVVIVAFSDEKSGKDSLIGDILAIVSAVCYGLYASFLRIRIKDETQVKMTMFFGFVGFFNLILMWPFFFILHYTGLERFEVPSLYATLILTLNGLIGTVFSDLLWSLVIFLTSATVATVGLSLNVPFSLILDLAIKHRKFSPPYYAGAFVVLVGFFVANLSH